MCKKDVEGGGVPSLALGSPRVPSGASRLSPLSFGGWGVLPFPARSGGPSAFSSFLFCGVLLWFLLLLSAVLFLLCSVSLGLGLPLSLASAGVRPPVPSLSGSRVRPRRWRVALVGRRLKRCRRWSLLSGLLALRVRLSPSACVLAGLPPVGSAPWLLLLLVPWRVSLPSCASPCPCCLSVAGVASVFFRLSSWWPGSPPLPGPLEGCRVGNP